jgi:hypothetical protein
MKVIIAGGRDYHLVRKDWQVIKFWRDKGFITHVVSGACKGVDTTAETWARMNRVPVKQFPGGRGTANMRKLAKEHGLEILYDAEGEK